MGNRDEAPKDIYQVITLKVEIERKKVAFEVTHCILLTFFFVGNSL